MKPKIDLLKSGVRWFFGLGCVLLTGLYLPSQILAAISALGLGVLLIPPSEKWFFSKIKKQIPVWGKIIAGVFLMGIMGANSPKITSETKQVKSIEPTPTAVTQAVQTETVVKELNEVVKVIDGDTVQVKVNGEPAVVRLIGIDTPESVDPRKPVQCFAGEATKKAKELLAVGKRIYLEVDLSQGDKDKYNRLLRYIFFEDGSNFSKVMISEGYAHEYTYQVPYKYMEEFKKAEAEAKQAKRGLWADDACLTAAVTAAPTAATQNNTSGGYSCGSKTTCGEMTTCAEAKYYLNTCGVSRLDGDKDGVPCETLCK